MKAWSQIVSTAEFSSHMLAKYFQYAPRRCTLAALDVRKGFHQLHETAYQRQA